jgi:hypothetical protein
MESRMSLNKLLTEWVNRNGASARRLRVIYLPVKYDEIRKSPIPVSARVAENPEKGCDARNPDCKHMCFSGVRSAQRFFL